MKWCFGFLFTLLAGGAFGFDGRSLVARADELIQAGQLAFARSYLDAAVSDPRLHSTERSRAYYLRGYAWHRSGLPVSARKDYNRALEFNPDNPKVLVELGRMHMMGDGTPVDTALGYQLYFRAADLGFPEGAYYVGQALLTGAGTTRNVLAAREWLEKARAAGVHRADLSLGASYRSNYSKPPDLMAARMHYERGLEAGEWHAAEALAHMYRTGEFGAVDHERAQALFQQAADGGVSSAATSLAHYLLSSSEDAARRYFELGAAGGDGAAFAGLGYLAEVAEDRQSALQHYRQGAVLEDAHAARALVRLLLASERPAEEEEAARWLGRAASRGSAAASNRYAWLLATSNVADLRNGTAAIRHAEFAVARKRSASYLDTLAAAYAEAGRFAEAALTQQEALEAIPAERSDLREELLARLVAYQSGQPWRQTGNSGTKTPP